MKRSGLVIKLGDRVTLTFPNGDAVGGVVTSISERALDVKIPPFYVWRFNRDGSRLNDADPDITHVNGVAIDDEPRPFGKVERAAELAENIAWMKGIQAKLSTSEKMAAALRQFCARVEAGEIRSVKTYAQFKQLLAEYEAL